MSSPVTLAEYLFTRLRQLGVEAIHGVPGDYNLDLLDYVKPSGLCWVSNCNELNAAFAADGYARIKGIGALVTTFGVGELSAINGIAGAYTEFAPVVHIVGTPPRASQDARLLVHHTFADGEYGRFAQMHAHVTVAQESLWDPRTCAQQIDNIVQQCLFHRRPVYIQVPADLVTTSLPADRLQRPIEIPVAGSDVDYDARDSVLAQPFGIVDDVHALIDATKWPTWTTPFGKGLFDETRSNFHGIYEGDFDENVVKETVNGADLVLFFGPHLSSSNTYGFTAIPSSQSTIFVKASQVELGIDTFRDVPAAFIASRLLRQLDLDKIARYDTYPPLPRDYSEPLGELADNHDPIGQHKLWRVLANILRPGDIVLGETGTAGYGAREMPLPPHTRLFTPVTWLSIGFMLPAAQGAAMAQRELIAAAPDHSGGIKSQTILLIGDGSLQMTAQEMATIIRHDLNVLVFLINNDGYTIERCIHGRKQEYNDVARWRYLETPRAFGTGEETYTAAVKTWAELYRVLGDEKLIRGEGLRMIEIFLDREDAPQGPLLHYLDTQKNQEMAQ
ncbi:pyruvate decarboxylase [Colletotrichum plurivorum]|uniref:Pyruvate decarboxylase n=1 Tax=Colletotrichum plurivorum TaxID=2175906 RepID=A0A8H6KCF3_9PEZI|nr:pyruvate decarboxylase [Colletotrichum plurivorum]